MSCATTQRTLASPRHVVFGAHVLDVRRVHGFRAACRHEDLDRVVTVADGASVQRALDAVVCFRLAGLGAFSACLCSSGSCVPSSLSAHHLRSADAPERSGLSQEPCYGAALDAGIGLCSSSWPAGKPGKRLTMRSPPPPSTGRRRASFRSIRPKAWPSVVPPSGPSTSKPAPSAATRRRRPDELKSLSFAEYLVAKKSFNHDAIGTLAKLIFTSRQALAAAIPGENQDPGARDRQGRQVVVHPGALAYLTDDQKSFFDKYGDGIFYGLLIFPIFGSAIAAVASYFRGTAAPGGCVCSSTCSISCRRSTRRPRSRRSTSCRSTPTTWWSRSFTRREGRIRRGRADLVRARARSGAVCDR